MLALKLHHVAPMRQSLKYQISINFLVVFTALSAFLPQARAAEYDLGHLLKGSQDSFSQRIKDYDKALESVVSGDTIRFGDQVFKIQGRLGLGSLGNRTIIFDIGDGRALRVPKTVRDLDFSCYFRKGATELEGSQLQKVKVFLDESPLDCHYVVVEKVNVLFTLEYFFAQRTQALSDTVLGVNVEKAMLALDRFMLSTYEFTRISDFWPFQVVFDGENWIVLDWAQGSVRTTSPYATPAFEDFGPALGIKRSDTYKKWVDAVIAKRKSCIDAIK
jgi:hypothetical protein